jgi:hypothetical protein
VAPSQREGLRSLTPSNRLPRSRSLGLVEPPALHRSLSLSKRLPPGRPHRSLSLSKRLPPGRPPRSLSLSKRSTTTIAEPVEAFDEHDR